MRRRVGTEPLREQAARLRAEVERWRDAVQALDDEDAAEQAGLGFLGHLSEAAATALARAVGSGRAWRRRAVGDGRPPSASTASTLARKREIAARKRAAERELAAAEARLSAAEQGGGKPKKVAFVEVTVDLEARVGTEAEIDLTYHVSGASWRPLYDLALDGERLNVSYLAEVTQQTGEDWPEVALVLSTTRARPEPDPARAEPLVHRPSAAARQWRRPPCSRRRGMADEPASADDVAEAAAAPGRRGLCRPQPEAATPGEQCSPPSRPRASPGPGSPTPLRARWRCPATADRTRPWSPASTPTRSSTT